MSKRIERLQFFFQFLSKNWFKKVDAIRFDSVITLAYEELNCADAFEFHLVWMSVVDECRILDRYLYNMY